MGMGDRLVTEPKGFISHHNVSVDEIIADPPYYADLLAERKALVFKELNPTRDEHQEMLSLLYQGKATEITDRRHGRIWDQDHSVMFNDGKHFNGIAIEDWMAPSRVRMGWHIDFPFWEKPPSLTSMHMTKCDYPAGVGRTWIMDLEQILFLLPLHLKSSLQNATLTHSTGNYADPNDPLASEQDGSSHSALRTHPVTGRTCFYWTGHNCLPEGSELYKFMRKLCDEYDENAPYLYAHEWSKGDLFIWDNRNLVHTFEGGWEFGSRVFDKVEYGYEQPYFEQ